MRTLLFVVVLCAATPALADGCGGLADQVSSATGVEASEREPDYVSFPAGQDITVTLACSSKTHASVGAHFRGEQPPDAYYKLFGQAGEAVTGIAADRISAAAQRARADAPRLRHSNVTTDGVLVTCTFSKTREGDPLTMCAVIARSDKV